MEWFSLFTFFSKFCKQYIVSLTRPWTGISIRKKCDIWTVYLNFFQLSPGLSISRPGSSIDTTKIFKDFWLWAGLFQLLISCQWFQSIGSSRNVRWWDLISTSWQTSSNRFEQKNCEVHYISYGFILLSNNGSYVTQCYFAFTRIMIPFSLSPTIAKSNASMKPVFH